jgi:hypothetical protein
MSKKMIAGVLVALTVAVIVIVPASLHMYYVSSGAGEDLFWNADEADVFLTVADRGYRLNYFQYVGEHIVESFGGVRLPNDQHFSAFVFRVTPEGVQRYVADNIYLGTLDIFEGSVYGRNLNNEMLMKWTETRFEPATPEEQQRFSPAKLPSTPNYDDFDGWSKRAGLVGTLPIQVGGKVITLVVKSGRMNGIVSVDLLRAGRPAERIWESNDEPRRVSKVEYERTFGKS